MIDPKKISITNFQKTLEAKWLEKKAAPSIDFKKFLL